MVARLSQVALALALACSAGTLSAVLVEGMALGDCKRGAGGLLDFSIWMMAWCRLKIGWDDKKDIGRGGELYLAVGSGVERSLEVGGLLIWVI